VHVARRVLGRDTLQKQGELLALDADVDVARSERAAVDARRAGTPAAYRAALSLYGGELLPENRYDDWAGVRRAALSELREALGLERLAAEHALRVAHLTGEVAAV
jgi:DNA-binding SARP family transcriptional activator